MTSRRSWLLGLALGAAITVTGLSTDVQAQSGVPRRISYQGQLLDNNGQPATGNHSITVNYYTTAGGAPIYTDNFTGVAVTNGIFNIQLGQGSANGFPASMDFNQQYLIKIAIDGGPEIAAPTLMLSAPYALNADRVNGIEATDAANPKANALIALDATGKFPASVIPAATGFIKTINGVPGDANDDLKIVAGSGITITNNTATNTITVASVGGGGTITGVTAGPGLTGGGTSGNVTLQLAPNAITSTEIGAGAVTGRKLDPFVAGNGIVQDALGNLDLNVDNSTLNIVGDVVQIKPGGVGTAQLADGSVTNPKIATGAVNARTVDASQVQLRVTGVAGPGRFIRSINQDGTVNDATVVSSDASMNTVTAANGIDRDVTINTAHTNSFTAVQNFNGGATASTLNVGPGLTTTTGLTNNGTFNNNGNVNITGSTVMGTAGTDGNVLTVNGVNGGLTELRVNGDASITGNTTIASNAGSNTIIGNATGTNTVFGATTFNQPVTAGSLNVTNLGGNPTGSPINLTSGINANTQTITGGTFSGYALNSGSINVGQTLTNNGTITGGAITNAAITGGTINNTPIGNITPSSGAFTTLNSSGTTTLATLNATTNVFGNGANQVNSFGVGPNANNTIGNTTGTNTINGLTNVGSLSADGNKMIVNGIVSPTPVTSGQFELVVNGDAQVTGTLSAGNIVTPSGTIGAPHGKFDDLDVFTSGNTAIKLLTNFDMQNHNINNVGNITQTSGTSSLMNTTVSGSLSSTGATSLATGTGNVIIGNAAGVNTINGAPGLNGTTFNSGVTFTQPVQHVAAGNIFGPTAPADGNYITVNGGVGGATEVNVNGDIAFTGNLTGGPGSVADFTSLKADNFSSHTPAGNINVNSPLALSGTNGISTVTGNFSSTSGSFTTTNGGLNVGGNSNISTNNGATVNMGTGTGSTVNVGSTTGTTNITGTTIVTGNGAVNALTVNGGNASAIAANATGANATLTLGHTAGTGHTIDVTSGDVHLGGTSAPANLNTTTVYNLNVEGNLSLLTGTFNVLTSSSPAITGKSTQDLGIGVRGISRPTSPNPPGTGVLGIALDNGSAAGAAESNTNPTSGNITFAGVNTGVLGVAANDAYYGGAFFNQNLDNPNGTDNVATALIARTWDNPGTSTTGRGILVEQLTAGNTLSTGIEVRNTTAGSTMFNGLHVNSNGGTMTTAILIDPPSVGIESWSNAEGATFNRGTGAIAGTTGIRIGTKSGVGLPATMANAPFETGARIDGGTTGMIVGGTTAPTFGADINFVGAATPTYGVRINSTVAGAGAGIIVGNTGNTQEGGVFNASTVGVRIGRNFAAAAGTAPVTGIEDNVTAAGTGMNITGVTTGTGINATTLTTGTGVNLATTSGTGVAMNTATGTGLNYTATGVGTAVNATTPGGVGLNVNAGAANGVVVTTPTTNGVNLVAMGGVTGVNYAGTTGTGFNYNGTTGTGLNYTATGAGTGANITTAGGNGVNVNAGASNGLVVTTPTTNGVNLLAMGAVTGVSYAGTTGTALNVTKTGAGNAVNITQVGGNGVNINAGTANGVNIASATTNGVNLTAMGAATGVMYSGTGTAFNAGTGASTGLAVDAATANGVNLTNMGAVTGVSYAGSTGTGLNITKTGAGNGINLTQAGGNAVNVNAGAATGVNVMNATVTGINVDNSTSNVTGIMSNGGTAAGINATSAGQNAAGVAAATAGSIGRNTAAPGAANGSTIGTLGRLGTTTVTGTDLNTLSGLTDFSAGVYGDASNAVNATARPGVIAVTNSNTRGAIEAFNTGTGPAASLYSNGITLMATTTGAYPVATAIEGRSINATSGVGMVGASTTPIATATAGAGLLGILSGGNPVNEPISNMYAGIVGTTGTTSDVSGGHDIGVIGADMNTAAVAITPGMAARIGLYGISGGAGANDAAVRAENQAAGGRGIQVSTVGGGNTHGVDIAVTGAAGFTGSVPNSYGIGIDMTGGATTGLYINGTGVASSYVPATGTGIYVDPAPIGIVSVATTTGAELMAQTDGAAGSTGLRVGQVAANRFETGATVTGTTTGLSLSGGTNALDVTAGNVQLSAATVINGAGGSPVVTGTNLQVGTAAGTAITLNTTTGTISRTGNIAINPGAANTLSTNGNLNVTGTATVQGATTTLGTDNAIGGALVMNDATAANTFTGTLKTVAALTANRTWSLPDMDGTVAIIPPGSTGFIEFEPSVAQVAVAGTRPLANVRGLATTTDGLTVDLATNAVTGAGNHSAFAGNVTSGAGAANATVISGTATGTGAGTSAGLNVTATSTGASSGTVTGANLTATGGATGTGAVRGAVINATGTATSGAVSGINVTATAANAVAVVGGSFTASGSTGSNTGVSASVTGVSAADNIGMSTTVSGSTGNNIGLDQTVSGTNATGVRMNIGAGGTGVLVNGTPTTGVRVPALQNNGTAFSATFQGGTNTVTTGLLIDMNNPVNNFPVGITVSNAGPAKGMAITTNTGTGIDINTTSSGTGLNITTGAGGKGATITTGNAIGVDINSGTASGVNVVTSTGTGLDVTSVNGTGARFSTATTSNAIDVVNGAVRSSAAGSANPAVASNRFADVITFGAVTAGPVTVNNNLVTTSSTVIVSYQNAAAGAAVFVQSVNNGNFTIQTTAPGFVAGDKVHYIIINH